MSDTPKRLEARLLIGWVMLILVAMALIAPSFVGWHHDDDLQNMRWVVEYRDAPWLALTDRHSVHDHIRPATLWATWVGAQLSNGAWWGPHLVMAILLLGGWLAMAVLVSRLMGSRVAGLLAAVIILDMEGFRLLMDWNSWINTAGEICFGLMGLILVHEALRRGAEGMSSGRAVLGAACCMLVAGLFKEPGWVVYPCTAALMAAGAWWRGDARRTPLWVCSLLLLGLLGFLWSHTSANVDRLGSIDVLRKLEDLKHAVRPWADPWPGPESGPRIWRGVALPLVGMAIAAAVVLRRSETPSEAQGRAIILGTAVLTGIGYVREDWVGLMLGLGLIAMLFLHKSRLLAALALLTAGVMFLFPGPNPVQLLMAAMAIAALVAVHAARLIRPGSPPALRLFAGIILVLGLGLQALQIADRVVSPDPSPRDVARQLSDRDQLLADAALFKGLESRLVFHSSELGPRLIAPLFDLHLIPYDPSLEPYSMQVSDALWVPRDTGSAAALLLEGNLLDAPRTVGRSGSMELDLEPGYYAVGMVLDNAQARAQISVQTTCKGEIKVRNVQSGATWVLSAFRIPEECGSVEVKTRAGSAGVVQDFYLSPLPEPEVDLRSATFHVAVLGLPRVGY